MNNESASALQKASFVLLVFIAAALAYLVVRDYLGSEWKSAEAPSSTATSSADAPTGRNGFNPNEMKSSFAPLRPRMETNVVRVLPARVVTAPANSATAPAEQLVADPVIVAPAVVVNAFPQPVAAAVTRGTANAPGGASLVGRVTLRGAPPLEKLVTLDALCGRLHPAPMTTRHYLVGDDGGLANVFVYVKSGVRSQKTSQQDTPVLDNLNCEFQPYVLGARAGQPFTIRNLDSTLHNVHAVSRARINPEFNLGLPVKGASIKRTLQSPEVLVQVKCDVHPWMFAYIGVVDHPWFAVTDGNGNFALPSGLPPGNYTLAAVHPKAGESLQQVTVNEGALPVTNFVLDVPDTLAKATH